MDEKYIEFEAADTQQTEHQPKEHTLQAVRASFQIEHESAHDLKHEDNATGKIPKAMKACKIHYL